MIGVERTPIGGTQPWRAGPWLMVLVPTVTVLVSASVGSALAGDSRLMPHALAAARYGGDEECAACHEDLLPAHESGYHGGIEPFQAPQGETGCEACHGPGSVHAESTEPGDIINPATADAGLVAELCLGCHRNDGLDGHEHSAHALGDVSCVGCHEVHGSQEPGLLQASEPALCNECHQDVRDQMFLPSHHPVREGKMVCTDCHDIHRGGFQGQLVGEAPNELCFSCHTNKQGPFVFEHDPVIEDCMICHSAHGAVANSLLLQNEPFLCLQCHQAHFHATLQGIEGEFESLEGYGGVSHRDSAKQAMLTKCSQCHTEVHGSDLPSQTISGGGRALTR